MLSSPDPVCLRLKHLREVHFGERGKSGFAKALGIGPSTYGHYELDRTPPVDILVRAARLTGTRLEWIVTGEGERRERLINPVSSLADRLSGRLREILTVRPDLAGYVENLIELLERMQREEGEVGAAGQGIAPKIPLAELIPIVGSTSAGTARYWSEWSDDKIGSSVDQRLAAVLARTETRPIRKRGELRGSAIEGMVALVQLNHPDESGFLEFLSAPHVKDIFPRSVAWRVDGDSMSPRYVDGDIVVTAVDQMAINGEPAVVKQRDQIGVNCKIYRDDGDDVVLIPINERREAQRIPKSQVEWAQRVVCSVRLTTRQ
ncbi:MAG: LexA family transcriptional regulator [Planctomycetaceae bacterium]